MSNENTENRNRNEIKKEINRKTYEITSRLKKKQIDH